MQRIRKTETHAALNAGFNLARSLFKYGSVGIIGTAAHYAVLLVLVESGLMSPVPASSTGFCVGAFVNHHLNRRFVFNGSAREYWQSGVRFAMVAAVGFIVNMLLMAILTFGEILPYIPAQIVATGFVFLMTFVFNRAWTFKRA